MPWVDALEIDQRLPAAGAEPHRAVPGRGGREDRHRRQRLAHAPRHRPHLDRGAGRAHARGVHAGLWRGPRARRRPPGQLLHDGVRHVAACRHFYREQAVGVRRKPLGWRRTRGSFGGVLGLPLVPVALVGASCTSSSRSGSTRTCCSIWSRGRRDRAHVPDWRPDMRVAIFTDNDFDKVNGVTTTLTALLAHAPADIRPRIYTAATLATRSAGLPRACGRSACRFRSTARCGCTCRAGGEYLRTRPRGSRRRVHLTTPGPAGPRGAVGRAAQPDCRWSAAFTRTWQPTPSILSGSPRLGALMREYMRWLYGRCGTCWCRRWRRGPLDASGGGRSDPDLAARRGHDAVLAGAAIGGAAGALARRIVSRRSLCRARVAGEGSRPAAGDAPASADAADAVPVDRRRRRADAAVAGGAVPGRGLHRRARTRRVAEAFASADLFVFPSRTDTAGNVVLEAQASGLPVIVSDAAARARTWWKG